MSTVTIGCAVQGGLIIGTDEWNNPIKLNGLPPPASGLNVGFGSAGAGFTNIDANFWATWSGNNATSPILTTGAIWEV